MLEYLTPTWMLTSIYRVQPDALKEKGIRAVLTDLDNTLVEWHTKEATQECMEWIHSMQDSGLQVVIVSNNSSGRIQKVAKAMGVPFISRAKKPSRLGLDRAMKLLDLGNDQVVMVGDQLLTDVFAGNRAGIRTIWVRQVSPTDEWKTWLNRFIERHLVVPILRRRMKVEWRDSINDHDSQ